MLEDFKENIINKSVVKFIDIVLDLYSPVPYQLRNQMRVLQNTLLFGYAKQLTEYMQNLKQKLQVRQKYRLSHHCNSQSNLLDKSPLKIIRNNLADQDKQNKFYLNNLKVNNSENLKKNDNILNMTYNQVPKTRKISAIQYINKQEDNLFENKKNSARETTQIGRNSSRTLLKIVKKSRSNKDKLPSTERSFSIQPIKAYEKLLSNVEEVLDIMDKNCHQFNMFIQEGLPNYQSV